MRQIDEWDAPFAAAGVTRPGAASRPAATRDVPCCSRRSRSPSRLSRRSSPPRRASSTSTSRRARPARRCGICSRTRPGCRSRRRSDRAAGPPPHLLQRGLPGSRRAPRRPRRDALRRLRARGGVRSARAGARPGGHPGAGMHGSLGDVLALARELLAPDARRAARPTPEMTSVQFPGLDGVLPDFGRFTPMDWGLGVEIKGAKSPTGRARCTSPRTFGHFGGCGTFLWVDPDARGRVRLPHDARVRRLGEGRRGRPLRCRPARVASAGASCALGGLRRRIQPVNCVERYPVAAREDARGDRERLQGPSATSARPKRLQRHRGASPVRSSRRSRRAAERRRESTSTCSIWSASRASSGARHGAEQPDALQLGDRTRARTSALRLRYRARRSHDRGAPVARRTWRDRPVAATEGANKL